MHPRDYLNVASFSGWAQPVNAMTPLVPADAVHHYHDYMSHDPATYFLNARPQAVDLAIGWSLGGRVLLNRIQSGSLEAKEVWLFGVPLKSLPNIDAFIEQYQRDEVNTMRKFNALIVKGHSNANVLKERVKPTLTPHSLAWLHTLREDMAIPPNVKAMTKHWVGADDALLNVNPFDEHINVLPKLGHALPYALNYQSLY